MYRPCTTTRPICCRSPAGGAFLPLPAPQYRLEFVGDSITSGEGAIGAVPEEAWAGAFFSAENHYARLTADALGAEYRCLSQSGWGIVTLVFLFVPLLLLFMFTYLPFFKMVEFNFFKMKYIGKRTFVGLRNCIDVFTRDDCFHALSLSLYYMAGSVVQMALALLFATILSFKCKGSKFFRGALYFPCLICGISVGFIFKFFFTHGFVLDTLLSWVGFNVDSLPFWLRDESINNIVLVACSIWKYIGQNIVMFIGAIASVDRPF